MGVEWATYQATEMFEVSKTLVLPQMHEIFKLKEQSQYNPRQSFLISRPLLSQPIMVLKVYHF